MLSIGSGFAIYFSSKSVRPVVFSLELCEIANFIYTAKNTEFAVGCIAVNRLLSLIAVPLWCAVP